MAYFKEQNSLIANGTADGVQLNFNSLGIINGIIDAATQMPYYSKFATNNTYNITAYNDTVRDYVDFALNMVLNGCLAQIEICASTNRTTPVDQAICAEAAAECRDNVEGPYYGYSGRNPVSKVIQL